MAAKLRERGCSVWGVEVDPEAAAKARAVCEDVVVADVEERRLQDLFPGLTFDAVLFLDVLEHMREPEKPLLGARQLLSPAGRVVASIPNVAHGSVRLGLLRGEFRYTDTGLLDRTHLRFFDVAAVADLFTVTGYKITEHLRTTRQLDDGGIDVAPEQFAPEVVEEVMKDPEALTFQFVVVARPLGTLQQADERASAETDEWRRSQQLAATGSEEHQRAGQLAELRRLAEHRDASTRKTILTSIAAPRLRLLHHHAANLLGSRTWRLLGKLPGGGDGLERVTATLSELALLAAAEPEPVDLGTRVIQLKATVGRLHDSRGYRVVVALKLAMLPTRGRGEFGIDALQAISNSLQDLIDSLATLDR